MFDGGDDLQGATALGALLDVDLEHSFTKPSLAFALQAGVRRSNRSQRFCEHRAQLMGVGAAGHLTVVAEGVRASSARAAVAERRSRPDP